VLRRKTTWGSQEHVNKKETEIWECLILDNIFVMRLFLLAETPFFSNRRHRRSSEWSPQEPCLWGHSFSQAGTVSKAFLTRIRCHPCETFAKWLMVSRTVGREVELTFIDRYRSKPRPFRQSLGIKCNFCWVACLQKVVLCGLQNEK
jgi:hypothetical protein